jgi:hypothetical protein
MIPNIFISSTINDLHYLRDAVRDVILEVGYRPIMSEYGDFGFQPYISVEDSCYNAMRECQITILIIGKKYGQVSSNGISITHNEFRVAKKHNIPVLCLIEKEVLSFKKIYEVNKEKNSNFPEMDASSKTFEFINEFMNSSVNNGYREYNNVNDVRINIKNQIAHFFGYLLVEKRNPLKSDMQDILSEIKTLRHELVNDQESSSNFKFLRTTRLLIDNKNSFLGTLLKSIADGDIDLAIIEFIKANSLEELLSKFEFRFELREVEDVMRMSEYEQSKSSENRPVAMTMIKDPIPFDIQEKYQQETATWWLMKNKRTIITNPLSKEYLTYLFNSIKNETFSQ